MCCNLYSYACTNKVNRQNTFPTAPHVPYDDTGRRTYEKICQKLDVVPSSKILRKLAESPSIDIRHYGLGPKGTMAVSVALVVSTHSSTCGVLRSLNRISVVFNNKLKFFLW